MSNRSIAEVTGVGHQTVARDLEKAGGPNGPPDATVTGADGRSYPAKRRANVVRESPTAPTTEASADTPEPESENVETVIR